MRLLVLALVLLCLPLVSRAQTVPPPASAVDTVPPSQLKILSQLDAPFRIVSAETKWATPEDSRTRRSVSIYVVVENISEHNVRAYATRRDMGGPGTAKACLSMNFLPGKVLRPGQKDGLVTWRGPWPAEPALAVWMDYVELSDGTVWGADKCHFSEQLDGMRSGARAQREELLKILQNEGPDAVLKFISDNFQSEATRQAIMRGEKAKIPIEPPSGHSQTWQEAFTSGARAIIERVIAGNREWGVTEVEVALRRPIDASEAK